MEWRKSAAQVAVALKPVPTALVELRTLTVLELTISSLQEKVQKLKHDAQSKRESDQPSSKQINQKTE
jgi:hypothetical protein